MKKLLLLPLVLLQFFTYAAYGSEPDSGQAIRLQLNYQKCLAGLVCERGWLTQSQLIQVDANRYERNYISCLNGFACEWEWLTSPQRAQVNERTYRRNYINCLNGFACEWEWLTNPQRIQVNEKAYERNYNNCLNGFACQRDWLTAEQASRIETSKQSSTSGTFGCAENGSCYGDISELTGRPKTVHVDGYYRKDGTYVRGHYRSKPKKK